MNRNPYILQTEDKKIPSQKKIEFGIIPLFMNH